jgi:hypothetical protein
MREISEPVGETTVNFSEPFGKTYTTYQIATSFLWCFFFSLLLCFFLWRCLLLCSVKGSASEASTLWSSGELSISCSCLSYSRYVTVPIVEIVNGVL